MPLPLPTPEALAHSHLLVGHIRKEIAASGGWIDFARYMEMCLYTPGLGYYSAGAAKLGAEGDFVTAPEISSLFGETLARPMATVLMETKGDILELGAGSGKLAFDVLAGLKDLDCLPNNYFILEVSADLKARQQSWFADKAPELLPKIKWLDRLPQQFTGVVLANEVLDAMPVHIVHWMDGKIYERGVSEIEGYFVWQNRLLDEGNLYQRIRDLSFASDYISEISLAIPAFIQSIGDVLLEGAVFLIDYGFKREEYYHPQRNRGTLMCHYRHHSHDDPFYLPGLQDITAHVDFTMVMESAANAGLSTALYTNQANFLIHCGITDLLSRYDPKDIATYLPVANQVQRLLSAAEMGELFKVIVLEKN